MYYPDTIKRRMSSLKATLVELSFAGAMGNTTFTDLADSNRVITNTGTATTGAAINSIKGTGAMVLGKNTDASIAIGTAPSLATGSYTVEGYLKCTATTGTEVISLLRNNKSTGTARFSLEVNVYADATVDCVAATDSNTINFKSGKIQCTFGEWFHIGFINNVSNQTFKVFIAGQLAGTYPGVIQFPTTTPLLVGVATNQIQNAFLDAYKISNKPLYTKAFPDPLARTNIAASVVSVPGQNSTIIMTPIKAIPSHSTGKWYFEIVKDSTTALNAGRYYYGLADAVTAFAESSPMPNISWACPFYTARSPNYTSLSASWDATKRLGVSVDFAAKVITYYYNGVVIGKDTLTTLNAPVYPAVGTNALSGIGSMSGNYPGGFALTYGNVLYLPTGFTPWGN